MGSKNPTIKYCEKTGKPHTLHYEDGLDVGLHRRGCQIIIPLGVDAWETICVAGKVNLVFTDEKQIDLLISRLQELRELKVNYAH